jgi:hypothetical protein
LSIFPHFIDSLCIKHSLLIQHHRPVNSHSMLSISFMSCPSSLCAHCSHRRITVSAWFTMICMLNMCIVTYLHKADLPIFYVVVVFIFRTLTSVNCSSYIDIIVTPTMCACAKFDLFTHKLSSNSQCNVTLPGVGTIPGVGMSAILRHSMRATCTF